MAPRYNNKKKKEKICDHVLALSAEFAVDVNCSGDARARDHFVPAFAPTLHERCNNEKRYRLCTGASV